MARQKRLLLVPVDMLDLKKDGLFQHLMTCNYIYYILDVSTQSKLNKMGVSWHIRAWLLMALDFKGSYQKYRMVLVCFFLVGFVKGEKWWENIEIEISSIHCIYVYYIFK